MAIMRFRLAAGVRLGFPGVRFGSPAIRFGLAAALWGALAPASASAGEGVSYSRDVLPILSENCFRCHGPDASSRKGKLRLDEREDALADHDGARPVVPGKPDESELIKRVTASVKRMPPEKSGDALTAEQIATLRAWIEQGAAWGGHWAFAPPGKPPIPVVASAGWPGASPANPPASPPASPPANPPANPPAPSPANPPLNPIDAFILARLEKEGLSPSPRADAATLLRRLSLDITGLPPNVVELDAFLAKDAKDPAAAYAEAADRLLASPHYGERWARVWLDSANYADSDGFEKDKPRQVWAWRDWVINAFNANMPYDRFIQEQIAGDLMPGAGRDQIVATGFLRNSMINEEGGIEPEQFRMEAMFSRMDVIGRAVLGLTTSCAQCHDHKFDPLKQSEYYGLMAYINNSHESCATIYSDAEEARRREIHGRIAGAEEKFKQAHPEWPAELEAWERKAAAQPRPFWLHLDLKFDDSTDGGQKFLPQGDASYLAAGYAPTHMSPKMWGDSPVPAVTAVRLDLLTDPNLPRNGPGRSIYGACALSEFELYVGPKSESMKDMGKWTRVKIASAIADVNPPKRALGPEFPADKKRDAFTGPVAMAIDDDGETAWTTDNDPDRRNQPRFAVLKLETPLAIGPDQRLGIRLNQNHGGKDSDNNQTNNIGRFRISVTDAAALPDEAISEEMARVIAQPESLRSPEERTDLFRRWMESRPERDLWDSLIASLWRELPSGTTQLVYRERGKLRETHRLERGDFLKPKELAEPSTPAWLNPPPRLAPPNRLGLAAWLTDPKAPTTARAFVNRVWQGYFGTGLVDTPSDLGLQGARPSHPELLDWLAVTFMESGWDVKALHRLIVASATYRQSSRATPELLEKDPKNRLLARGSRIRVDGEIVRDIALTASGLLNEKIGGPSVHPPAPEFLFAPPASYGPKEWNVDKDAERYRRGLYTFRFRSVPYPALQVFDTPDGSAPCVRRERSNSPLQALTLLNEPLFVECARSLAKQALEKGGATDGDRLDWAFRRCTSRKPESEDLAVLADFLGKQRERLAGGELKAAAILELKETETADPEWAAWTLAARAILGLDETITRE